RASFNRDAVGARLNCLSCLEVESERRAKGLTVALVRVQVDQLRQVVLLVRKAICETTRDPVGRELDGRGRRLGVVRHLIGRAARAAVRTALRAAVRAALRAAIRAALRAAIRAAFGAAIRAALRAAVRT